MVQNVDTTKKMSLLRKVSKLLIVLVFFLFFTMGLTSCEQTVLNNEESDPAIDDTQIVKIERDADLFDIDDGYVYFGRETCSSCIAFLPILTEVANDQGITVYYFDTGYFRGNSLLSEEELQTIFTDYQVLSVPIVVEMRDGEPCSTLIPKFNEQKDNTSDIKESIKTFFD